MPLMEITLQASYNGQECINRWNYLASGTPAAVTFSYALVHAFGAIPSVGVYPTNTILSRLAATQDSAVVFEQIACRDVYSVVDFYTTLFTPTFNGAQAGIGLGPVSAMGYRTNRTRLDIRRGTKRFTGINIGALVGDNVYTSAQIALMNALATEMGDNQTFDDEGNTLTFQPVIVGREKYNSDPEDPTKFAYRYYPTFAEQEDHLMASITWDMYTSQRSQSSRQIGRGR